MKQETLEEARANSYIDFAKSNKDVSAYSFVAGWDKGSKWEQERSYSEGDIKLAFEAGHKKGFSGYPNTENWKELSFEKWFEQFKKK